MAKINALDTLPIDCLVSVNGKIGRVVKSEIVDAHPCGKVALNTIVFTHRMIKSRGNDGHRIVKIELLAKPSKPIGINYASICTLN
jgi:hypothetical protein